jgi:hypothetical protein
MMLGGDVEELYRAPAYRTPNRMGCRCDNLSFTVCEML